MKRNYVQQLLVVLCGISLSPTMMAQLDWRGEAERTGTITWMQPLEMAADILQERYSRPITFEDPVWRWRGDFDVLGPDRLGREVLRVKRHTLTLPSGLTPDKTPVLDATQLTRVLGAYHEQNPERTRFQVLESGIWLQIVPAQVHDESGTLKAGGSLLDTPVLVPVASRTPSEHLIALCRAVTSANTPGMTLEPNAGPAPGDPFNRLFAANGYILRGSLRALGDPLDDSDERPYILFSWGTSLVPARQALVDLMTRSGTTLTWHLACGAGDSTCWLNILPVWVHTGPRGTRSMLYLDRCPDCRPIPHSQP